MDQITLDGNLGPVHSFELDIELETLTRNLRPIVTVDLSAASDVHASVAAVLIRHQRQARRQGGSVRLLAPTNAPARRTLDHIGLVSISPAVR